MLPLFKKDRARTTPFPAEWHFLLVRNVPFYSRLAPREQKLLQQLISQFVREKNFEGCAGLRITDEIRVTIAAHACLLLLGPKRELYPGISSILVYPRSYVAPEQLRHGEAGPTESHRLGEAWRLGTVVLSWQDVMQVAAPSATGRNVVAHEFAHVLDHEESELEGVPRLPHPSLYGLWTQVLTTELEAVRTRLALGLPDVIDEYGTTNPAEFFAVATESLFEQPHQLYQEHPELYALLSSFYGRDPAAAGAARSMLLRKAALKFPGSRLAELERQARWSLLARLLLAVPFLWLFLVLERRSALLINLLILGAIVFSMALREVREWWKR